MTINIIIIIIPTTTIITTNIVIFAKRLWKWWQWKDMHEDIICNYSVSNRLSSSLHSPATLVVVNLDSRTSVSYRTFARTSNGVRRL